MDSKVLCVTLLLGVFCLWYTEASPMEEKDAKAEIEMHPEDTKAAISDHTAKVAGWSARTYANKAKATESKARLCQQLSKDRFYYSREYNKLAEDAKKKSREYKQLYEAESTRISQHQNRQREWSSKGREAHTQCKETEIKSQQEYTKFRELKRESIMASVEAAIQEAMSTANHVKGDRLGEMARELKRKAENLANEASSHYQKSKEDEARATAEKVKSHQQADDCKAHNSASRAYQQEALRARMDSRANLMKYIQSSLLAERAANEARESELRSEWSSKQADALARMSEESASISKILLHEAQTYAQKAKQDEAKGWEYAESKKMMGSEMAEAGELLSMAQAKDESVEEDHHYRLTNYNVDDPVKLISSDDKEAYVDEGMR